ncbi:hypothetical protein BGZ63DRAFT_148944 [Mariannaea sp. PMI_226]|nr:hypothetical protein BGZ63DRAFT_148944 [Mariannaea sp. PMI_226]
MNLLWILAVRYLGQGLISAVSAVMTGRACPSVFTVKANTQNKCDAILRERWTPPSACLRFWSTTALSTLFFVVLCIGTYRKFPSRRPYFFSAFRQDPVDATMKLGSAGQPYL